MKPKGGENAGFVTGRMKLLPRRHRIAHLRALLRQPHASSVGREQLAALRCLEMMAQAANENHPT
jgi:hypothetical protein